MSEKPRDWDRELAEIDKVIARAPATPPQRAPGSAPVPAAPAPGTGVPAGAPVPPARRGARAGAWLATLLVAALAVGIPFWPYGQACGIGLIGYIAAIGVLVLASVWALAVTWRQRIGLAHVLATITLLWGLGLAAAVLLPRIGYASESLGWNCTA
ncbi:MAG TPA: hypothetical protein VF037_11070 [Gemmatimonadales bacterium]